jgi:Fe-S cluster biogenesis protein NfuA
MITEMTTEMSTETSLATDTPSATPDASTVDPRALTIPNVERVLDELRPYLMADGGNVEIVEIDGPVVKVRLQGACGSCPSSTMTLKMGIERKLREAIPEVSEVVQVL